MNLLTFFVIIDALAFATVAGCTAYIIGNRIYSIFKNA